MRCAIAAAGSLLGYVEETQKSRAAAPARPGRRKSLRNHCAGRGDAAQSRTRYASERSHRAHVARRARSDDHTDGCRARCAAGCIVRCAITRSAAALSGDRKSRSRTAQSRDLREMLRGIGDLERILARVALRSARPRDLSTLRDGLLAAPALRDALAGSDSPLLGAAARPARRASSTPPRISLRPFSNSRRRCCATAASSALVSMPSSTSCVCCRRTPISSSSISKRARRQRPASRR